MGGFRRGAWVASCAVAVGLCLTSIGPPVRAAAGVGDDPRHSVLAAASAGATPTPTMKPGLWNLVNPLPTAVLVFDADFVGDEGWMVGGMGTVLRTVDGGATWAPESTGISEDLGCVSFADGLHGWVASPSGSVFGTVDGGRTWNRQFKEVRDTWLLSMDCFDAQHAVVLSFDGTVYATSDGGATWARTAFSLPRSVDSATARSICMRSASEWVVVGGSWDSKRGGYIARTSDGGATWSYKTDVPNLFGVAFFDRLTGWATADNAVLRTTDGGVTWTAAETPLAKGGRIESVDAEHVWALAGFGTQLYGSSDGGRTWSLRRGSEFSEVSGGGGLVCTPAGIVCAFDAERQLFGLSHDGGSTWVSEPESGLRNALWAGWFADDKTGWVLQQSPTPAVLKTTDGGMTWARQELSSDVRECPSSIAFASSTTGVITADNSGRGVWRTTDGGETWVSTPVDDAWHLKKAIFLDSANGIAVGAGVFKTGDGGATWTNRFRTEALGGFTTLWDVVFTDSAHGTACGMRSTQAGSMGVIVSTSDGGLTWSEAASGPGWFSSLVFHDAQRGLAFSDSADSPVFETLDGGRTWSVKSTQGFALSQVRFCSYGDHGRQLVAADVHGAIQVSRDMGTTWFAEKSPTSFSVHGGCIAATGDTWLFGASGLVLFRPYAPTLYSLEYKAGSGGTISGTASQTVAYSASGTAVTAVPTVGYHFVNWSDGLLTATRADTNVSADASLTASFAINTYQLHYAAGGNGTISGTASQTVVYNGSGKAVTGAPATGYHFVSWSDGVSTATRTDSSVTADKSATANFALNAYAITASAGIGGSISRRGISTVDHGADSATYTITPAAGYAIGSVVVDGVSRGALTSYVFTNVTTTHTISVTFKHVAKLTIASAHATSSGGHAVTFSGTITPNVANNTHVTVWIRKSTTSTWSLLSTRHTVSSHHWSYSLSTKTRSHGTYYLQARYAGSSTLTSVTSASKKLVIK